MAAGKRGQLKRVPAAIRQAIVRRPSRYEDRRAVTGLRVNAIENHLATALLHAKELIRVFDLDTNVLLGL